MSLDFCLINPNPEMRACECSTCGHEHMAPEDAELFSANITHNLDRMAEAAGIYECLWRPEEALPPFATAAQCITVLENGLAIMQAEPQRFRRFDAANGWGTYDQFVPWVQRLLDACKRHPEALVRASR